MSDNYDFECIGPVLSYTCGEGSLNEVFNEDDVEWIDTPAPSDYPVVEVFCKCRASIGKVGLPAKDGAQMIQVEFRCADCGHATWWRSAR